jgi:hypothetical protein
MADYSPAALAADIRSGPLAAALAPLVAAGSDAGIAAAYNAIDGTYTALVSVPSVWVLQWAALTGVRRRIEAAANDLTSPAADAALAVRDFWWGVGTQGPFELTSPLVQGLLQTLAASTVTIGGQPVPVLNASGSGSVADLNSWGTVPCSYAEHAWSPPTLINQTQSVARGTIVSATDVSFALRGAR